VWVRNTTEAINTVAEGFDFSKRRQVVMSNLEHHSLLLPFQRLAIEKKIDLQFVKADGEAQFAPSAWANAISKNTALVAVHHTTNTAGTSPNLPEIIKAAHDNGALVLLDCAQGAAHSPIDLQRLGADFIAFSAHKMCGPTGIGALVGTPEALSSLRTHNIGGETISTATLDSHVPMPVPKRFEAGIQHYSGAIGFAASCKYLSAIGMENIASHEKKLVQMLQSQLEADTALREKLVFYGPQSASMRSSAILAFNLKGISAHQVSITLDKLAGIAVRSGVFCAQPAMEHFGAPNGAVRASLYFYNTEEEITKFVSALKTASALCVMPKVRECRS
jgi:cysteine desulfurase / selenocysteine lyase